MSFDLNINSYTKNELLDLFDLPPHYDKYNVEVKENKLKDNIIKSDLINEEIKIKTINFLFKVKNILLNDIGEKCSDNNNESIQGIVKNLYNSSYELKPVALEDPSEHMIQIKKKNPYLSSFPSEYVPGVINPLKKKVIKKVLNIDTRFRNNYYSSPSTNFNVNLPILINNVLAMQLSSIELPTTYYAISKQFGNNFFSVIINDVSQVVSVSDGNYNKEGIISAINNALTNLGGDFQYVYFFININTTDNTNGSGQMMVGLKSSVPSSFNFELNFQANRFGIDDRNTPLPLKFGWMLGFRNGVYVNNQNYVSEGIVDLSGPKYLFLVVDDFNNNTNNGYYSAFNSSLLNKSILARISLTSSVFSIFNENNYNIVTTPREYFGPVNIQTLNIQLLDEYGRVLELNNMDYSFSLNLTVVYDI
jgi:hypothetical protein